MTRINRSDYYLCYPWPVLDSVIRVPHVGDLSDGFADHFGKVARSDDVTASTFSNVRSAITGFEHVLDRLFDITRILFQTERMPQHHRRRSNGAARIRAALARDVGRRAV